MAAVRDQFYAQQPSLSKNQSRISFGVEISGHILAYEHTTDYGWNVILDDMQWFQGVFWVFKPFQVVTYLKAIRSVLQHHETPDKHANIRLKASLHEYTRVQHIVLVELETSGINVA